MSVNKAMILGHVGNDVEMHHFENGGSIGKVSIATNETYTDKTSGEKVTKTEWHNVVFRNKTAEIVEKYVKKGDQIFVEGKIQTRSYEVNNEKKYITEIVALSFSFVGGKTNSGASENSSTPAPAMANQEDDGLAF